VTVAVPVREERTALMPVAGEPALVIGMVRRRTCLPWVSRAGAVAAGIVDDD
jgi:hypothetical protein